MSASEFESIASFLPLRADLQSGDLRWCSPVESALKSVARGPQVSSVRNGQDLCDCIMDLREETMQCSEFSAQYAKRIASGLTRFFDESQGADVFYSSLLPAIAKIAVQLPEFLKAHGKEATRLSTGSTNLKLRVLRTQQPGMVLLSQSLIASLLACAFFCLYPSAYKKRKENDVHPINFDSLFRGAQQGGSQAEKLKCLVHYFERICSKLPQGTVSYERKILPRRPLLTQTLAHSPTEEMWKNSTRPLCRMDVVDSGAIEDSGLDFIQVDFANMYLGGGALQHGCVQEEIRFMINPELIAGMLFMSSMANNEAIEIVGAEQFSQYRGYASSFRYAGDFTDRTPSDSWGRRKTCITAIDAICGPGEAQFELGLITRELNKAYCGFSRHSTICGGLDTSTSDCRQESSDNQAQVEIRDWNGRSSQHQGPGHCIMHLDQKGVATGNWGSGAFGGNLELKSLLQWMAASEAGRSQVLYFSFDDPRTSRLEEVVDWISKEGWSVSELFSVVVEYGRCRLNNPSIEHELFEWILPTASSSSLDE